MMQTGFNPKQPLNGARRPVMATITTAEFDRTLAAYHDVLEYDIVDQSRLSADMAQHWGLAGLKGSRLAIMRPKSEAPIFLRFLEIPPAEPRPPSCGWFALEICVRDVEALHARLLDSHDFTPFAPPMAMAFTDRVYPMQCKGPAGEILYLNQVRGSLPDIDLPVARSFVDHLFIAILSAPDMEASNDFYSDVLGMSVNERHEIAYKTINRVHGLPIETRHKLSTLGGPRQVALEVDQYPGLANSPRRATEDRIGEGILMVSFTMDTLSRALKSGLGSRQTFSDAPYNGAESVVLFGPGAERVELIKAA